MKTIQGNREGASMVELLVALTMLGVVLTSMAGMTFEAARRSVVVAGSGYQRGIMTQEVNRVTALPFANLASANGCTTVATGIFPHRRCVTITPVNSTRSQIMIVIVPGQPGVPPDTVRFERWNPPTVNPLFTP